MTNSLPWKDPPFLIGEPSINKPFSMAMLNNHRVNSVQFSYPPVSSNVTGWENAVNGGV